MSVSLDYLTLAATNALTNYECASVNFTESDGRIIFIVLSKINNKLTTKFFSEWLDANKYVIKLITDENCLWITEDTLFARKGG